MKRISLVLAGALACLLVASVGTAAAMPTEEIVNTTCNTTSKNVIGNKVTITVDRQERRPDADAIRQCERGQKVANKDCSRCGSRSRRCRRLPLHPDAS